MLCSKSCAPKYRSEMVKPCAACQKLVNGDYKCMICNQNIHLQCVANPTVEGKQDVLCPSCSYSNGNVQSDDGMSDGDYSASVSENSQSVSSIDGCDGDPPLQDDNAMLVDDVPVDISKCFIRLIVNVCIH